VKDVVLFGIGSPIVVEYAETCRRLGRSIVAAVRNRSGSRYFPDAAKIVDVDNLPADLERWPCLCPMFTPLNRYIASVEAARCGLAFPDALIDPTAIVAASARIGGGSYLNAGCIVGAECELSEHVLLNRGASVGHHVRIGAFASLGPGAIVGGQARIGFGAMLGAGAIVLPQVTVGAHAVVGAGTVAVSDVPGRCKVYGNPGRIVATGLPGFDEPDREATPQDDPDRLRRHQVV
jgi:acetyltransferase-like isoleucine patch superfamily enzyme